MPRPALEKCSAELSVEPEGSSFALSGPAPDSHFRNVATFSGGQDRKLAGITASANEVAAALGLKETSFRRKMRAMHRDLGFPLPLRGGNWTWSTRAVAIWIEAQSGIYAEPALPGAAAARDEAEHEDEAITAPIILAQKRDLRRRYGGRA